VSALHCLPCLEAAEAFFRTQEYSEILHGRAGESEAEPARCTFYKLVSAAPAFGVESETTATVSPLLRYPREYVRNSKANQMMPAENHTRSLLNLLASSHADGLSGLHSRAPR
jgi:hypothetical protein